MSCAVLIVALLLFALGAARAAADTSVEFKSPLGNINCRGDRVPPACISWLTLKSDWRAYPVRTCQEGEFFNDNSLGINRGMRFLELGGCHNDVGPICIPQRKALAYGDHVDINLIRCSSARNGVTCRYFKGRRVGFRIAYEGYTVWRA
jgi:hypothetical protein